jgi:hypothetical protein
MTDEEIRIKVAETMGWKPDPETKFWYALGPDEILAGFKDGIVSPLPDYLNDLNACAEFEATLTDEELEAYREHLSELLNDTARIGLGFTAKPKMRCLAYLKTKGILP